MHIEHLSHWSGNLNREMYVNRYGHAGIPVVVFASSGGSHNEYYDFGMINACASFIEEGRVQFFTLSSVDSESWLATWKNSHDQAEMHRAYERYVIEEAIPFIKHKTGWFDGMMTSPSKSLLPASGTSATVAVTLHAARSSSSWLKKPSPFGTKTCAISS